MAPLHFVILLSAAAPATALPNAEHTYSYHSARLRAHLLNETYEKMAVPISSRSDGGTDGTLVSFALRIFKVKDVDTSTGSLRLKVWFRLRWTDLRLAWDPAEFGGVTQAHMRAAAITNDQDSDILPPTTDVCTAPLRELGESSKTRSYVQGHRDVHYMDATFAFFSYLKLPARGYAKIPFSV